MSVYDRPSSSTLTHHKERPLATVFMGQSGVGKSTMIRGSPDSAHGGPTIGSEFHVRRVTMPSPEDDGDEAVLHIFDLAGQARFDSLCRNYYQRAECALLIFQVLDAASWDRVEAWFHELRDHDPTMGIVLVANKSDLFTASAFPMAESVVALSSDGDDGDDEDDDSDEDDDDESVDGGHDGAVEHHGRNVTPPPPPSSSPPLIDIALDGSFAPHTPVAAAGTSSSSSRVVSGGNNSHEMDALVEWYQTWERVLDFSKVNRVPLHVTSNVTSQGIQDVFISAVHEGRRCRRAHEERDRERDAFVLDSRNHDGVIVKTAPTTTTTMMRGRAHPIYLRSPALWTSSSSSSSVGTDGSMGRTRCC